MIFRLRTGHCRLRSHMKKIGIEKSTLCPMHTGSTNHSPCPAVMPSPKKRKFPRKHTPWNSHRHTPDGAVHRPDGTTNITSLHRTLKRKNQFTFIKVFDQEIDFTSFLNSFNYFSSLSSLTMMSCVCFLYGMFCKGISYSMLIFFEMFILYYVCVDVVVQWTDCLYFLYKLYYIVKGILTQLIDVIVKLKSWSSSYVTFK